MQLGTNQRVTIFWQLVLRTPIMCFLFRTTYTSGLKSKDIENKKFITITYYYQMKQARTDE